MRFIPNIRRTCVVKGHTNFPAVRQFADAVQFVDSEGVTLGMLQQVIHVRMEMQHGDDGHKGRQRTRAIPTIIDRLVCWIRRDTYFREDEAMAQFVGEDIKVLAIWSEVVGSAAPFTPPPIAKLQKAIAGLCIIPFDERNEL